MLASFFLFFRWFWLMARCLQFFSAVMAFLTVGSLAADDFRVHPYIQNPSSTSMTIQWFSHSLSSGIVEVSCEDAASSPTSVIQRESSPELANTLAYNPFQEEPGGPHPSLPFRHTIVLDDLKPLTKYRYRVTQGSDTVEGSFRTAGDLNTPIRLLVYSDSETEPESTTSPPVAWPVTAASNRPAGVVNYLANQTDGYLQNCRLMQSRSPDLLLITGDLVECGGEQRDWDEFWKHNAGEFGQIASSVPILPAIGNHENYAGPGGGYTTPAANFSTAKYLTYFRVPNNAAKDPNHHGRYYRIDYGPITLITLDSSDGLPHKTASDTNHNMEGSFAPDFNPGSEQYQWLEKQLAEGQKTSRFTFVQFHHTMFGSGPHSVPFGHEKFSGQAGIPMRVLLPLFMKYGVDVVFSGHDEMLERSEVVGMEQTPDAKSRPHQIHFYDVGMGGDGLRGPSEGFDNPYCKFLAHRDALEVWKDGKLISGGKHYGHLEVNIGPDSIGKWTVNIEPVHVFPVTGDDGKIVSWERRVYNDIIKITQP
jgi:3',5'-cyclic AMP phosphodiesterase CpdA